MSNLETWNLLVGAAMPFLVGVIVQSGWPRGLRAALGVVTCLVAGGLTVWIEKGSVVWTGDLVGGMLVTAVTAGALLETFWRPTGIYDSVKDVTSLSKPPPG